MHWCWLKTHYRWTSIHKYSSRKKLKSFHFHVNTLYSYRSYNEFTAADSSWCQVTDSRGALIKTTQSWCFLTVKQSDPWCFLAQHFWDGAHSPLGVMGLVKVVSFGDEGGHFSSCQCYSKREGVALFTDVRQGNKAWIIDAAPRRAGNITGNKTVTGSAGLTVNSPLCLSWSGCPSQSVTHILIQCALLTSIIHFPVLIVAHITKN